MAIHNPIRQIVIEVSRDGKPSQVAYYFHGETTGEATEASDFKPSPTRDYLEALEKLIAIGLEFYAKAKWIP